MRIRLALLSTLVALGAVAALPASAAAAETGYAYKVVYDYCQGKTVHYKIKNIAEGSTPANKLTIESWAQKRVDGRWRTVHSWERAKYRFAANGDRHWVTSWRQYNGVARQQVPHPDAAAGLGRQRHAGLGGRVQRELLTTQIT